MMDIREIEELIDKINASGLTEFRYETENINLVIKKERTEVVYAEPARQQMVPQIAVNTINTENTVNTEKKVEQQGNIVKSPIVGTFYASSNPKAEPFVKVGDKVKKGDVLCIVEAMKLMNEIESEVSGEIVEVLVKDAQMVEYGQPLFVMK
ncbi:MAG: acetyl-CoA carboxylase, biotin carboxyl carrier protein [Clostridiales bacterium GWE2_32_10]|nr:MAG: acetyl-CoA carboxylase, biotin carboxyl carrier protein [Clostridiales bacterium GWE2_32_10]HBY20816.1 acetyl-CoA carboxylase biotin carboxyl carrier protein [Clostridiales bacterium]